jgi:hypothetical protein
MLPGAATTQAHITRQNGFQAPKDGRSDVAHADNRDAHATEPES